MKSLTGDIHRASESFCVPEPECGWEQHDRDIADRLEAERMLDLESERARKLVVMGVPYPLHSVILAGPSDTKAIVAARTLIKDDTKLALFWGATGCGKTLAAATWLLHAPIVRGKYRRDVRPRRFLNASDYCTTSPYEGDDFEGVAKAAYLVLDDLGQEYEDKRGYSNQRIDELVTRRHADMLPTLITTNLSIQSIRDRYGDRVASRLNDAQVTPLRGEPDLRAVKP